MPNQKSKSICKSKKSNANNPELDEKLVNYAKKGKVAKVKECINEGANVNKILEDGDNVLFQVMKTIPFTEDHYKVMKILINSGIEVSLRIWDAEKKSHITLLHLACVAENIQALDLLIKSGAELNFKDCIPLLHLTVQLGNFKMTEALLKHKLIKNKIDIQAPGYEETPLHNAVGLGHNDIALLLIEHGSNVNAKDHEGTPIIHTAAGKSSAEVVKKCLEKGADVHAKGYGNTNPLKMAIIFRQAEIVKILLAHGADPNERCIGGSTALHTSVSKEGMEDDNIIGTFIFKQLIDNGASVNVREDNGVTPLHYAAKYGKIVEVEYLIRGGAEIDAQKDDGFTPLAYAIVGGQLATVKALIKAGARLDMRTNDNTNGAMPLHLAAQIGKADIVRFLVRSGAEVDAKDNQGNTPLRYATANSVDHQSVVIDFLLCEGAQMNAGGCCIECLKQMDYL